MGKSRGAFAVTLINQQDIRRHKEEGSWKRLEAVAVQLVLDASQRAGSELKPLLGGGTRLMLAMEHRISDDIDLFIRDPQWIGFLTPRLNDSFEHLVNAYDEGATSLKLKLAEGEIDFIVGMSLLGLPAEHSLDSQFSLEPVAEVLAKKLFYRGWALTPRDLFDWWSIETKLPQELTHAQQLADLISKRIEPIEATLKIMNASGNSLLAWNKIRAPNKPSMKDIVRWGQQRLSDLRKLAR
jgi:hypothetical protein